MGRFGRISIALLCSIVAIPVGFIVGFYLLLAIDHNYHDGVSGVGGLVVAVIAAVVTFRVIRKKLNLSLDNK
jgi:prolipoprotein diacylglyceryltransferase